MQLVLLSHDLMIGARVAGVARQQGLAVLTVTQHSAAVAAASEPESRLLLVDLRLPGLQVEALVTAVRACRELHLPIVAYGPHVHEANLETAREAGCDVVVTRGRLDREAEIIVANLIGS